MGHNTHCKFDEDDDEKKTEKAEGCSYDGDVTGLLQGYTNLLLSQTGNLPTRDSGAAESEQKQERIIREDDPLRKKEKEGRKVIISTRMNGTTNVFSRTPILCGEKNI